MRRFPVPFDLDFEDKIVGGKFSMRQALWIFAPVFFGIFTFTNPARFSVTVDGQSVIIWSKILLRLIEILVFSVIGVIMAFYKKHDISIDKYILKCIKYELDKRSVKFYE